MKIFLTGGTGYVGGRVLAGLRTAGHEVFALSRSVEKHPLLVAGGATPIAGDLTDAAAYRDVARDADVVIHIGFDYRAAIDADRTAIDTLLSATEGRAARVIYTSGMWVVGDTGGRTYGDDAPTDDPATIVRWRVPHERLVLEATSGNRVTAVVRPGYVYGRGGGSTARMFATAAKSGVADFVGEGTNHWNNIHVDDLARLFVAVAESDRPGLFQAVDGAPEPVSTVARAACLAAGGDGSTRPIPVDQAREKIGPVADAMCLDQLLTAPAARALGWNPVHPSFTSAAPKAFEEWEAARAR